MFIIQLIIIQVIIFAGLVFFLRKVMITSSYSQTQRLQQLNQENRKQAQELERQVSDAKIEYRQKIKDAEEEVKKIKARAVEEVEKLKEGMLKEAKEEKDFIIQQAINEKEKMREEIADEMIKNAGDHSCQMIQKILSSKSQQLLHHGLIDEILEELQGVSKETFPQEGKVSIKMAQTISEDQKRMIQSILDSKMNTSVEIGEVIDGSMIGGMVLTIGSLVIDGSLKAKLKSRDTSHFLLF